MFVIGTIHGFGKIGSLSNMLSNNQKNKLKTAGYFIKRLKDAGYVTLRMFDKYGENDSRKWTVLVDPSGSSVYITCFEDRPFKDEYLFSLKMVTNVLVEGMSLKRALLKSLYSDLLIMM